MTTKIVLTGGGTAGHINPALALASELEKHDCEIYYAGTPAGVESRLVPAAGYPYKAFNVSGFDRQKPWTALTMLAKLAKTKSEATEWLKEISPGAVVGFGGYVSVPVMNAAQKLKIKTAIHEQNSVMGMANAELAKSADLVCLTYDVAGEKVKDKSKLIVTGNPVRGEVMTATREEGLATFGISKKSKVCLIFGGSLGAKSINDAVCKLKDELLSHKGWEFIHVAGKRDYEWVKETLGLNEREQKRYHLLDYCYEMPKALACADAILSRAGATSLAEISALCIPALLVPFPFATADHQTMNAKEYVEAGAAYEVADSELSSSQFKTLLFDLLDNEETRKGMKAASAKFDSVGAAANLCNAVLSLLK